MQVHKNKFKIKLLAQALLLALGAQSVTGFAYADSEPQQLPTGVFISPLALAGATQQALNPGLPDYPNFIASGAVISRLSPDGNTLAVLTAGQNSLYKTGGSTDVANSTQYIFIYDVSGAMKQRPMLLKAVKQTNSHVGMVWSTDGTRLYTTGGNDDKVYAYDNSGALLNTIALGHNKKGIGLSVQPNASGLAISADGKTLVVANNYNDSISIIDTDSLTVRYEHDLRPFFASNEGTDGVAGGTYPFAVAVKGNGTAYVSANRDREVVAIDISSPAAGKLITRIKLHGNPLGMTLDAAQKTLYVAQDNSDEVAVIDTDSNTVTDNIDTRGPVDVVEKMNKGHQHDGSRYTGASPIAVTISPDGKTLYAVNDGANSIAVIPLHGGRANKVTGLIPTAYAPKDITFSADGKWMYIINGKSNTGPNPGHLFGNTSRLTSSTYLGGVVLENGDPVAPAKTSAYPQGNGCDANCAADNAVAVNNARASNQYQFQLEQASLVSAPVPGTDKLGDLTERVSANNYYNADPADSSAAVMAFLHKKIKHVIYVVKENRTFDQILGDLNNHSDGDSRLTVFGEAITPNLHRLSRNFVTLDRFMDPGDGSMDGWSWATRGRVTSTEAITQQLNYSAVNRGLSYESEGGNRNVPVGLDSIADRDAASAGAFSAASASLPGGSGNLLVGTADHSATDSPLGPQQGYIFDAALRAGLTVRNYGFLVNNIGAIKDSAGNEIADPYNSGVQQVAALNPRLLDSTDLYFRGYDQSYPDLWRYNEWKREFDQYVANRNLPSLTTFRVSHDHMGNFGTALAAVNTPETQQADDDLAVGKLVEAVAHSPYAKDTLIIITEDDCQDGPDHVDSHRATAYVVGPYVKKQAVVSTFYSQVNALRTIEDILGTEHINLNTAKQMPMVDVFDIKSTPDWTYTAVASTVLQTTTLDLGNTSFAKSPRVLPMHTAEYWAKATQDFDFTEADQVPPARFNEVLWKGMKSDMPYPGSHSVFGKLAKDADND